MELSDWINENFAGENIAIKQLFQSECIEADQTILPQLLVKLKTDTSLSFNMLVTITAIDRKEYFEVFYHLRSTSNNKQLFILVRLNDRENPVLPSITNLWKSAELFELEVYDLFGIKFEGHPDLRRLFNPDDWQGYPLRKDYVPAEVADQYLATHNQLLK